MMATDSRYVDNRRHSHVNDFFEGFFEFYVRDWKRRYRIFALVLIASVSYGVMMNIVFHRNEDQVTLEFVGLGIFLMIVLPICSISRQIRAESLRRSRQNLDRNQSEEPLRSPRKTPAVKINGNDVSLSDLLHAEGELALDTLGKVLTESARSVERSEEHEWRPMFLPIMREVGGAFPNHLTAYKILVPLAHKNDWPAWAVRCLPSLYAEIETEGDDNVVAYVSQYVLGGVPPEYGVRISDKFCQGEILKVVMSKETASKVKRISDDLATYLRHNPNESDRGFLGTIVTVWSQKEKFSEDVRDIATAQKLKSERTKILVDERVMAVAA